MRAGDVDSLTAVLSARGVVKAVEGDDFRKQRPALLRDMQALTMNSLFEEKRETKV